MPATVPDYDDLDLNEQLQMRCSWGVFGADDDLGTINHIDEEAVRGGLAAARQGRIVNLSLPLDLPDPSWSPRRSRYEHHIYFSRRNSQDDYLDRFYLQGSSQWDGLRHRQAREFGFYNNVSVDEAGADGSRLGIEAWAEHGVVTRGVLLDAAKHYEAQGTPIDARAEFEIPTEKLSIIAEEQGVEIRPGDVLLVRTGYLGTYLQADAAGREAFAEKRDCPGLTAEESMARFLWNHRVAAVATDSPAVEVVPGSREKGSLHRRLIPMLGFAIGEFFLLEELAEVCAQRAAYDFLFTSVPLNLPGGVGSPANAIAVV